MSGRIFFVITGIVLLLLAIVIIFVPSIKKKVFKASGSKFQRSMIYLHHDKSPCSQQHWNCTMDKISKCEHQCNIDYGSNTLEDYSNCVFTCLRSKPTCDQQYDCISDPLVIYKS